MRQACFWWAISQPPDPYCPLHFYSSGCSCLLCIFIKFSLCATHCARYWACGGDGKKKYCNISSRLLPISLGLYGFKIPLIQPSPYLSSMAYNWWFPSLLFHRKDHHSFTKLPWLILLFFTKLVFFLLPFLLILLTSLWLFFTEHSMLHSSPSITHQCDILAIFCCSFKFLRWLFFENVSFKILPCLISLICFLDHHTCEHK